MKRKSRDLVEIAEEDAKSMNQVKRLKLTGVI